ncbi:glycoside hydrolase family 2 protein [Pontiella sulfatireligans]|uniref:Beta-glucuronidase n=1 Tax=Pontiella sulfatireligans TaxID=2750658 RepID=A0A6C2UIG6_9BACT|nr:sugar-binding domain-containing protein [Pontiella sulfatireligans]VGO19749.1 Beta-glucuronidase [Pontiella sulfatireligans]
MTFSKTLSVFVITSLLLGNVSARETQSLDGAWNIAFDAGNIGREAGWHKGKVFRELDNRREIAVPSCWELTEKDYEGVAFYRRSFTVKPEWKGKVVRLQFDAVNFLAEVWVNGVAVGIHEGGFTPFEFRIDDLLKFDASNTVALRVVGPILMQDKQIDGMGPMETVQWRGGITGGIWQPVRLVATDEVFVDDVFIEPKIANNTATFHLNLEHTGAKTLPAKVDVRIFSDGVVAEISQTLELVPGENHQSFTMEIPNAVYWSPDNPHLYRVEVDVLFDGQSSDQWSTRFGMREFTIRDKQFVLNGEPMFLKATFFEGLYPRGIAYPDSREMAIHEIQLALDAGFNMIRPWRKPPPPMWLDLCDEMGVLTVGSLAVECMDFPFESANLPRWVENEVRESILRDRNRTCVVQWELFNELKRPVLMRLLHPMAMLSRKLDPTRLILDESGGWAQGANMFLPYESEPMKFNDIHDYPGPQVSEEVYRKLILTGLKTHKEMQAMGLKGRMPGKNVIPGLMSFFSELGYGSLPDLVDNNRRFAEEGNPLAPATVYHLRMEDNYRQALKQSGLDAIYPDLRQFCLDEQVVHGRANKLMIEAVRCNPRVKGYCVHALTGGDWIMGAGLLDLWRNPKTYVYEGTKAANQPRIASVRVWPRNVYAEKGAKIEVAGVNELDVVRGRLKVEIVAEDGSVVFSKKAKSEMTKGIAPLFEEQLDTGNLKGTYTVKVQLTAKGGAVVAANEYAFDVFATDQLVVPGQRIAIHDPWNDLKPFLKKAGIGFEVFNMTTDPSLPVFVSRTEAKTKEERMVFSELAAFAKCGGTVVYLGGGGERYGWGKPVPVPAYLPVKCGTKLARGTWAPITHLVHDHPIFAGLPTHCMMGSIYENIWAERTLVGAGGEMVAGAIGFDWFPELDKRRRHYYGPGDTWYGSDVAVVPVGEGRCILSQLRLIDFLGKDPVAEIIFCNMIEFASAPVK